MSVVRVLILALVTAIWGPAFTSFDRLALAQERPKPAPTDEYVPIDQLPPQEELPAAPMVVAAYSFVWVAFVAYVFTIVKRLRKVETDLVRLERDQR